MSEPLPDFLKTYRRGFLGLASLLLLLVCRQTVAAIEPSFNLQSCAWNGGVIVVATEGAKIDGQLIVLEVWKGGLKPGDVLSVPELAAFAPLPKRVVYSGYSAGRKSAAPAYVTGSRMVLFLTKPSHPGGSWQPADSPRGGMKASVVWIEGSVSYAFEQMINPGPTLLTAFPTITEGNMKKMVLSIDGQQDRLRAAVQNPDPVLRSQALEPFVHSDLYYARRDALDALSRCGRSALLVLRAMLRDETLADQHGEIIEVIGTVGGRSVGPELTALIGSELSFWRKTAPRLRQGWWNGTGLPWAKVQGLRDRYSTLYSALIALARIKYQGDAKVVAELRDFWKSQPQLEDKSGLYQMTKTCDSILREKSEGP